MKRIKLSNAFFVALAIFSLSVSLGTGCGGGGGGGKPHPKNPDGGAPGYDPGEEMPNPPENGVH